MFLGRQIMRPEEDFVPNTNICGCEKQSGNSNLSAPVEVLQIESHFIQKVKLVDIHALLFYHPIDIAPK